MIRIAINISKNIVMRKSGRFIPRDVRLIDVKGMKEMVILSILVPTIVLVNFRNIV
jgi:hypothetical protein